MKRDRFDLTPMDREALLWSAILAAVLIAFAFKWLP